MGRLPAEMAALEAQGSNMDYETPIKFLRVVWLNAAQSPDKPFTAQDAKTFLLALSVDIDVQVVDVATAQLGEGVTGVAILKESSMSVHTYFERGLVCVEVMANIEKTTRDVAVSAMDILKGIGLNVTGTHTLHTFFCGPTP